MRQVPRTWLEPITLTRHVGVLPLVSGDTAFVEESPFFTLERLPELLGRGEALFGVDLEAVATTATRWPCVVASAGERGRGGGDAPDMM
mmetsp:Transcript_8573/g.20275  ORF Transcript_8573/g.20275 Transcript_8573/m.20275 type:complete len:89 (-) Transcript_8573:664-930(-)